MQINKWSLGLADKLFIIEGNVFTVSCGFPEWDLAGSMSLKTMSYAVTFMQIVGYDIVKVQEGVTIQLNFF